MAENEPVDANAQDDQVADAESQVDEAQDEGSVPTPNDVAAKAPSRQDHPEEDHQDEVEQDDSADEDDDSADSSEASKKLLRKVQKQNAENKKLRQRATDAESKVLRYEVASEMGLELRHAKRLVGSTREELVKDAEQLIKDGFAGLSLPGMLPDDGRSVRRGVNPEDETDLAKIGARMYER